VSRAPPPWRHRSISAAMRLHSQSSMQSSNSRRQFATTQRMQVRLESESAMDEASRSMAASAAGPGVHASSVWTLASGAGDPSVLPTFVLPSATEASRIGRVLPPSDEAVAGAVGSSPVDDPHPIANAVTISPTTKQHIFMSSSSLSVGRHRRDGHPQA
jgi:hypothetical protein